MTFRERLLAALHHTEPDRVPFDLGTTQVTTISLRAYEALREHLRLPRREPQVVDVIQQVVRPHDDLLELSGGFAFCTVHNIQPDVPPAHLVVMREALRQFGHR